MTKIDKLEIKIIEFGELLIFPITLIILILTLPILLMYYIYKWYIKYDSAINEVDEFKEGVTEIDD